MAVQWLRLCTSTAGGAGSIPGQGNKIPKAALDAGKKNKHPRVRLCPMPIIITIIVVSNVKGVSKSKRLSI